MQNEALTILTNYCVVKPGVSVSLSNPCNSLARGGPATLAVAKEAHIEPNKANCLTELCEWRPQHDDFLNQENT